jgi:Zn-dependent protease with chaperone function
LIQGINADYFDGKSSRRYLVTLVVRDGMVSVSGDGVAFEVPARAVKISGRVSDMPRRLEFPDGAAAVTQDNDAVDDAFAVAAHRTLAHRLESRLGYVVLALVLTVLVCWAGYRYGVPWAAREIALHIPPGLESELAQESLRGFDGYVFRPTRLTATRQEELTKVFAGLREAAAQPSSVHLEFRDANWVGPNAFALPGGVVVMTDQLVELLGDDKQIAAVLAHELGHVERRHSLRYVLQDSITALVTMAIYGDASAAAGIAVAVPTALLHAQYSQGFEREADEYAFQLLKRTGRSPLALGRALKALELGSQARNQNGKRDSRDFGYLSTHPPTEERIRAAEEGAR